MSKRTSKMYPKIYLLYKMCPSSYKKMGKKIFINKKSRTRPKKIEKQKPKTMERAEPNSIKITIRAETYLVRD